MQLPETLDRSEKIDANLSLLLSDLELPNTDRSRAAAGAFIVALDVHTSIIGLIRSGNTPSAFILSRSIWEALVRGFWLAECASPMQIKKFIDDNLDRATWNMIKDLEDTESFDEETLSEIHSKNSKRHNAMTHVGGPLVVRCNSSRGVEYNFDDKEMMECLDHASVNAILAAVGLAELANDAELGRKLFELQAEWFEHSKQ